MKNGSQTELVDVCRKELMPFLKTFGFGEKNSGCHNGSFCYNIENAVLGILVEFEPRYIYPRLFLYPITERKKQTELCELLKERAPGLIFPTEKTEVYLTELVRSVVKGSKLRRRGYPEDISFENVLVHYRKALLQAIPDVLKNGIPV